MADNMECEICGGRDFYKESGYFYCNECQTQSQEVREHVFDEDYVNVKSSKKLKKDEPKKIEKKITSWECYNIVMFSLTEQLISLGADKNLKAIVKCLWMKYLKKLEVFSLETDIKPKLQLVNSKRDSDILYGVVKKKKRKRGKSSDESSMSLDSNSTKRELSKRKRELVQAHYEEFSQKSNQETTSLQNETLSSLKISSEKSEKTEESIFFNRYASTEIKKKMSSSHWKKHKLDKGRQLQCHKLTYTNCSKQYKRGIHYLSPVKLYCILYLGLLINRDEIQLGDLFRYIREGHITFNNYTKLFPEEYVDKFLNIQTNNKKSLYSNSCFRQTCAKMAIFLNVTEYIRVVDLVKLCERYCNEMNLPDEICTAVKNILSKTRPKLAFTNKSKTIPNYEGRAMSIILFVLKLLFGLDGATEWEMTKYARCVNDLNIDKPKMFDIIKWVEYIAYRDLVVSEHHFPSQYLKNSDEIDSDLFLKCIKSQRAEPDENAKLWKEMRAYKEVLLKIKDCQNNDDDCINFRPSLTPYLDYSLILSSSKYDLHCSFQDNSLDFLLRPNKYLRLVSNDVEVKHGGANVNWTIEDLKTHCKMTHLSNANKKLRPIEITRDGRETNIEEVVPSEPKTLKIKSVPCSAQVREKSQEYIFYKNEIYVEQVSKEVQFKEEIKRNRKSDFYTVHYNPYEKYWLYLQMNFDKINKSVCDTHFDKHARTFKLICNECARIMEQTVAEFLTEFQFSELYLVYSASFDKRKAKQKLNYNIKHYVNQAIDHW